MIMSTVPELFGCMVFDDKVMRARLSAGVYRSLRDTMNKGKKLDLSLANAVADAMCEWAVENGATHFTHWFQPLTGITAEKHDSFISPTSDGGVIMEFSGKELVQGEPDASSFPSGGLRATFEARGYTAWDPTSYAFIKDDTLCIPTAFCSYSGEALDKKTPLLRSMEVISKQAVRILRLFGNTDPHLTVRTTVGPEQEYFLIPVELYNKRKDLIYTGRTLFGAKAPKGQELEDHYFGSIKPRVSAYMKDLDEELWKLGVLAKTKHNEVAPAQHELAPIFTTTNIATDHNQLMMEIMQKVAKKHGLVCLLHEKPFAGVNGSGKHNNWSISTNKGVDVHQDLLRISVATAGNDHRLGANEAPPAVVSMFLGDELNEIIESIVSGSQYSQHEKVQMEIGVDVLPKFPKDSTDRNRTSPFAFTGNKFEFRMLGSANSIACANIMLNTAVADSLCEFADRLEKASDFNAELAAVIKETITAHKRIIFNGNGYDESWIKEATEDRGLLNLRSTPEAMERFLDQKNKDLFLKFGVFSLAEMQSRHDILLENYSKIINIEALTMIDMARKDILPAVTEYIKELADTAIAVKQAAGVEAVFEKDLISKLTKLQGDIAERTQVLEDAVIEVHEISDILAQSYAYRDKVFVAMQDLRAAADQAESLVSAKVWPFPSYGELLFGVR